MNMEIIEQVMTEEERLSALYDLSILDSPVEAEYNSLVELASFVTGCPISMVSLIDKDRQWFKAKVGLEISETHRSVAFCNHTIKGDMLLEVNNALSDDRFRNNPLVTGPLGVRFYAGIPIYSPSGHKIGTVCTLDSQPRVLTSEQREALKNIAIQASKLLELRKQNQQVVSLFKAKLELERQTILYQMQQQEEERELISNELLENFAQTVAAALHFKQKAGLNPEIRDVYLDKVEELLNELYKDLHRLSENINPSGMTNTGAADKLKNLIDDFCLLTGETVTFNCKGELDQLHPRKVSNLFRVIMEYLHTFEQNTSKKVLIKVDLEITSEVVLKIWSEEDNFLNQFDRKVVQNSIQKRCELVEGSLSVKWDDLNKSILVIKFPIAN